ncbi:MAG: DUF262 domain-containing protein [Chloroflexi bacterium]|nr:DUF262 domain-containing protein [Chloroflexota bacterium]
MAETKASQPQNQSKKYEHLFTNIDSGQMKIPVFQRDFVWTTAQTAKLIDSIIKGFPIGTFIFWKTREELRHVRNIGNVALPDIPSGDAALYVLDGQQRITSLYAVRKGAISEKDGQQIDYRRVSINLSLDPNSDENVVMPEPPEKTPYISVYELLNGSLAGLAKDYGTYLETIDLYRQRLTGYDFSTIVIEDYPIDVACEVFTRINTGGTELTLFEIMVAKTYELDRFDLAHEYEYLINNNGNGKDLEDAGYDTVPASTVLQCVAAYLCGQVRAKDILKLKKSSFIAAWPVVKDGIFAAADYLRTHLRIPVSLLLPYHALLVPFTYFFIKTGGDQPSDIQDKLLVQYFWWASLSSRFSSAVESKLAQDISRMDAILAGKPPSYQGEEVRLTMDDLRWRWFSTGDAFCKAILCLYAFHEPKSFKSNSVLKIDNSWLKVANSKNYHHFFPKSYLTTKLGFPDWQANSVLNITLVDDYLNKRKIGARAPSVYMREFHASNHKLAQTMRTHLIDDLDEFGVWTDDYPRFIEMRGQGVLAELKERLEPNLP